MNKQNSKIGLSILLALTLALIAIVPASAGKPFMIKEHIIEEGPYELCDHEMWVHEELDWRGTFWEDRGMEFYLQRYTTFTNPENGNNLTLHGSHIDRSYWISDDEYIWYMNGLQEFATIPGHGVVWGYAGTIELHVTNCHLDGDEWVCDYELLHAGGMDFIDEETVCNYLIYGE